MTREEKFSAFSSISRWLRSQDEDEDEDEEEIMSGSPKLDSGSRDYYDDIMADFSVEKYHYAGCHPDHRNVLPGGDMPEEFILVEGCTISFMVSQGFYDKFQGLALCVVFSVEDGEKEIFFDIVPHINSQRRNVLLGSLSSFYSSHMWIQYLKPNPLWGVLEGAIDFLEFDEDYLQFSLTIKLSGGSVEKLGYVLRCMQMDDNLKVVLEDNQLINPASIYKLEWSDFECKFLGRGQVCQMEEVEASNNSEVDNNDNSEVEASDNSNNSDSETD
ncbi:hypothetical protein BT93_H1849 [Corymbia citriodora subsp. variegata]|nr:hypothetical protein BT93_H1849 [Corymbia citriodora subsp. variegata]